MKHRQILLCSHIWRWLIALLLLLGLAVMPAFAEQTPSATVDPLKPTDLTYENGNIILHKQGERIGPDEWKVTVKATVGEQPVEKRKMEVVFVLDASGSMAWCTDETAHAAGNHTHKSSCYGNTYVCGKEQHTHSWDKNCYSSTQCTISNHWNWNSHKSNTSCLKRNNAYYPLICEKVVHSHDNSCRAIICGKDNCSHSNRGETACTYTDANGVTHNYTTRIEAAKDAIGQLASGLPSDVSKKYVAFSSKGYIDTNADAIVMSNYDSLNARGATKMMAGVNLGIQQFGKDDATKVLVIVTDGESEDGYTSNSFKTFVNNGGVVYTVGFNHTNTNLANMAANGGSYMQAGNTDALLNSMQKIEMALTAMLEDPMGTTVGFEKTSIEEIQTSGGVISSNNDTIYWHPAEDGNSSINNSTIAYSYTVKLNEKAEMGVGEHLNVPLNNPTNFLYGIKGSDNVADMKSAAFPIPKAKYEISSIQTKWQYNGKDIQEPTEVEKIICDYASATYIPAFKKVDYTTITPVIPVPRSSDYYRYIGTTVTANNQQLPGVEAVDATKPVAYVVIHQYELVDSDEMVVGGTKTLIGRDFKSGDSFTFTLTADTASAPMPEKSTVTINPTSGTSMAFSFGKIVYTQAGTYTYTIKETPGNLTNVIYDTTEHKLVVTVTEVNWEMVVSYTMDGVKNGALTVTNRLETGSLKVVKSEVISHLAEHQEKEFGFVINVKDASNHPLNGEYSITLPNAATQSLTFTNGYAVLKLKAGESVVINGLPDGASYTVTEDAAGGFTATATGDRGTIVANQTQTATFKNEYASAGSYQFRAKKTLEEATLQQGEFSFSVLNEAGTVVAQGTTNADGNVFLDELVFTHELLGTNKTITQTYTVMENIGTSASYIYDRTRYTVTLTIVDNGDGTLSVTDNLKETNTVLQFDNQYISSQLVVNKMVTGNLSSKNRDFSFNLSMPAMAGKSVQISTDGGATYQSVTLNEQGQTRFTLRDGQSFSIYPVTGDYTVTETDAGGYSTTYAINQGTPVNGTQASGTVDANGSSVTFVNTLESSVPTGVRTSAASAIMSLCLALGLLATVFAGRRWSRCER